MRTLSALFDPWAPGTAYAVGDVAGYDDGEGPRLYECRQAHTSQADWQPPSTAATILAALAGWIVLSAVP